MKQTPRTICTLMLCALATSAVHAQQEEAAAPIPDFLQGLSEQQLNRKSIQRFLHNYRMRANPDGTLPDAPGARLLPQLNTLSTSNVTAFPYVLNSRWTALGPQPITGGQIGNTLTNRPMSGRVASLAVHPTNNNRWLVGTAGGGLWETKDGGINFVALTDAAPSLAIGAIAYAPSNPNVIYLGTGEATFSAVSFGGEGVLKSVDGGVNWQQLATATFIKGTAFSSLHVDPANANILVAATSLGIFGRPSARPPGFGSRGLWRSVDGGANWTQTLTLDGISIAPRPGAFNQQYAGLGFGTAAPNAVQRSTDGGATWAAVPGPWTSLSGNTVRTEVVIAPSNSSRVYVAVSRDFSPGGMFGLWTTANAWDANPTWTQISLAPTDDGTGTWGPCAFDKAFNSVSPQCWYNMTLTVKPTDENMLFFGGIPVWRYERLTNTWTEVSQTAAPANRNNGIHVDQHASAWAGSTLIMGNDGGVWSTTTDGTGPWATHNATLATVQYYEGSALPDASALIGGSQDNGTHKRGVTNAWPLIFGGDGAGNVYTSATNFGVSSQNQNVFRTTNGGVTFNFVANYGGVAPFIGKLRECTTSGGAVHVIANGSRVNRSLNFYGTGPSWSNGASILGSAGSAIAFGFDGNCNTIAIGHDDGRIRIGTNGGLTAADIVDKDPANQVPNRPIATIAFDPVNATKVCVGLSGFSGGSPANAFCTGNFTAASPTWSNVSVPVDVSVNSLVFDPAVANRIYAGSDFGVWVTSDGGTSWAHWGPGVGMPNVPVFDLVARGGKLFAFTHGRGAFVLSNFDLNNDAVVSCADVNIVKAAMGKKIGDVGFNSQADLNGDNVINIRDLAMLTRQLPAGTSC